MSAPHLHPERLIDALLRGEVSAAQRAELEEHVRVCATCAAEQQLRAALGGSSVMARLGFSSLALTPEASPLSNPHGDRQIVDRVLDTLGAEGRFVTSERAATSSAGASGVSVGGVTGAWSSWLLALCVFFSGSAAAATLIVALRPAAPRAPQISPAPAPTTTEPTAHSNELEPVAQRIPDVQAGAEAVARKVHPSRERSGVSSKPGVVRSAAEETSAAELFAQARAAHLAHQSQRAVTLYAKLGQRFPSSTEAHVSQVMLGRLYLEELNAPRTALVHFDRYLARPGPNQPEALIGRARCLRALGRGAEEIQTLRTLIERYPDSFYVEPARARMRGAE
jgi:TolA-binding protein